MSSPKIKAQQQLTPKGLRHFVPSCFPSTTYSSWSSNSQIVVCEINLKKYYYCGEEPTPSREKGTRNIIFLEKRTYMQVALNHRKRWPTVLTREMQINDTKIPLLNYQTNTVPKCDDTRGHVLACVTMNTKWSSLYAGERCNSLRIICAL